MQPETFAVRLAWACGYFAEITHFVASGTIEGAGALSRAAPCLDQEGCFVDARFELDDPEVEKLFEEHSWSWTGNPFVGTPELAGLKIILMLISNWDNKDQRDVARGSNTAIYVTRVSRWKREAQYLIVDWGGSMGRWGGNVVTRGRWDAAGFAAQTPQFVTGVANGFVQFGYTGQRTADARAGIRVEDVAVAVPLSRPHHRRPAARRPHRQRRDRRRDRRPSPRRCATASSSCARVAEVRSDKSQTGVRSVHRQQVKNSGSACDSDLTLPLPDQRQTCPGLVRAVGRAVQGSSGQGWRG